MADTATAPAGLYAKSFLTRHHLWDSLKGRIIQVPNVRAATALIQRDEATAGILYASELHSGDRIESCFAVDPRDHPPIIYPIVLIRSTLHRERAKRLIDFITSDEAMAIFETYGYRSHHP